MSEPPTRIRPAQPADAAALAEFTARMFVETFGPENTGEDMQAYVQNSFNIDRVKHEITDESSTVLIAHRDGAIAGYARVAEHEPRTADRPGIELVRMYVDSPHHGSGLADALMDACLAEARRRGHHTMWLGVWEHNPRAQRFYARHGFVRVGEQVFVLGDDRQTDWIMQRAI